MARPRRAPSRTTALSPDHIDGSRNGLERQRVTDIQRARMLTAMAEAACELGAANVTVAHVVGRSGVSRRTFYEAFADREECLLATLDSAIERIAERVVPAYEQHEKWRERMRAGLEALLLFLEEEPFLGRLAIVQALGAGPEALERRRRVLACAIAAVDEGRRESKSGAEPPPLTAEGIAGAVLSVIHSRLLEDGEPALIELTNPLMGMIVLPYIGPAAARREMARPTPEEARRAGRAGLRSLRDLDMRLTYRTMRVLLAIGDHPGSSNREVADAAEVHDQGQVSKLLRRLEDLGLVRNAQRRVTGEANAWTLTERGVSVHEAISAAP